METDDIPKEGVKPAGGPRNWRTICRSSFFFWALSLFLLGMGMKFIMMQQCVNPVPYFDQWEGEAAAVYVPYFEHTLGISDLFYPQNEHRIFFTHIYDLALLLLNGQWDSQLQMVLNAIIHSATVAGFGWLLAVKLGRRFYFFIWLPLAVALMSPFGWENALCGFQSQFYFLLLFSLLTIWLLGSEPLSRPWKWGILAGICSLLTMASGLLAAVTVGGMTVLEIAKDRREWRRYLPTLGTCVAIAVAGLLLKGRHVSEKDWHAQSFHAFLLALGNNLSWPTGLWPWLAPLNLVPLLALAWVYFRSKEKNLAAERLILAVGLWAILQSFATAYARGFEGRPPTWRYMDTLCFLLTANFLSVAVLIGRYRKNLPLRPVWCAVFAVWLVPCVISLWLLNGRAWSLALPSWAHHQEIRFETTRAFILSDDEKVFANHEENDLPWFYVPELTFLLRSKDIRPILPACVREPIKLVPKQDGVSAFVTNGCPQAKSDPPTEVCFGSYSGAGPGARGTFESAPMKSSLPYLEMAVSGNLGREGLDLELVETTSGKSIKVVPKVSPGNSWQNVYVKAPAGEFKIVARDESDTGWFAFKAPREMGRLSFWAMQLIRTGKTLLILGFVSLAAALVTLKTGKSEQPGR